MIPLHRPGSSPVHRMPVELKFVTVFACAAAVSMLRENPWAVAAVWGVAVLGFLCSGAGAAGLGAQLWRLRWLLVLLTVPQLLFLTPEETAFNVARVTGVVMLAAVFTLTTPTSAVLNAFERVLTPLERAGLGRLGFSAGRVSLALSLTIRSVPVILSFHREIRQAQRARGLRGGLRTGMLRSVLPLLVMSLRHAEETAEALAARGVR